MEVVDLLFKAGGFAVVTLFQLAWRFKRATFVLIVTWLVANSV